MDEGLPIAYEALETGVSVYASGGEQVGTVDQILAAPEEDIFHGLVIRAGGARRFVPADQVASLHERGVNLGIDVAAVQVLPPPEPDSPARRVREPGVKPSRWRKLWDMITGADPKREDWSEEE